MRQAGTILSKHDAERFVNYLIALGIAAKAEPAGNEWAIWIRDENQVDRSRQELDRFQAEPGDPRYEAAEREAKLALKQLAQKTRAAQKNYVDMRSYWDSPVRRRPLTVALIAASVLVSLLTEMGRAQSASYLRISTHMLDLADVVHGQAWRLITPIFIHYGWMHLVFNMMWLYDLGTIIEIRLGWLRFALLVLVIAVISNVGQFVANGPFFGGMSGVVFGLLAFAWIRGRYDPACGMYIHPNTVMFMFGWFLICLFNLFPGLHAANTAHGAGLAVGAAIGYVPHIRKVLRQKT